MLFFLYRAISLALSIISTSALAQAQTAREKRISPVDPNQRQTFDRQPKVAVLAGVGHYTQRSGLTQLRYPAHDVELIQAELVKQGYKVVSLTDGEATRGSIEQALRDVSELVDHGSGTVLFFFSGHGFADQGANYLATYEASAANLARSGMPVKEVQDLLKSTGAPRQMMFIDACRNEAGKGTGARSFANLQSASGLRALLSTKAGHISYEDDSLGSGVFTHFLVQGLKGQAAGRDGLITFRDLADYVTDSVSTYGFQKGQMQVPYEAGEASGDFLIGRRVAGSDSTIDVPVNPIERPMKAGIVAGTEKVNPRDGQIYVWIPPGNFNMGCSSGDSFCLDNEKPSHFVQITTGFWLGQTPVTQKAFRNVLGTDPSSAKGDTLPVETVTWTEAKQYCETIGGRLPTEAEWEYSARAGTSGSGYGNGYLPSGSSGNSADQTHAVKTGEPNAWKLYDMLGNLWQWTADQYRENYESGVASSGPGSPFGDLRSLRGSSWDVPQNLRFSFRDKLDPSSRYRVVGFRCVSE